MGSRSCIWGDPPSRNEGLCRETGRVFGPSPEGPSCLLQGVPKTSGTPWGCPVAGDLGPRDRGQGVFRVSLGPDPPCGSLSPPHKERMKGNKLCAEDKGSREAAHDRRLSLAQTRPRDAMGRAQPGFWSWRTQKALTLRAPRLCTFLYYGLEFKVRDADMEAWRGLWEGDGGIWGRW